MQTGVSLVVWSHLFSFWFHKRFITMYLYWDACSIYSLVGFISGIPFLTQWLNLLQLLLNLKLMLTHWWHSSIWKWWKPCLSSIEAVGECQAQMSSYPFDSFSEEWGYLLSLLPRSWIRFSIYPPIYPPRTVLIPDSLSSLLPKLWFPCGWDQVFLLIVSS